MMATVMTIKYGSLSSGIFVFKGYNNIELVNIKIDQCNRN